MLSFRINDLPDLKSRFSCISRLYFGYVAHLFFRIHKPLSETDILELPKKRFASISGEEVERRWINQKPGSKSLIFVLLSVFWKNLLYATTICSLEGIFMLSMIPLYSQVLRYMNKEISTGPAIAYLLAMIACYHCASLANNWALYESYCLGFEIRAAFTRFVYVMCLKIPVQKLNTITAGQLSSVISNDAYSFDELSMYSAQVLSGIFRVVVVFIYSYYAIDKYAAFAICTYLLMYGLLPIYLLLLRWIRNRVNALVDSRLQYMSLYCRYAQTLKMCCLDAVSRSIVQRISKKETLLYIVKNLIEASSCIFPIIFNAMVTITYILVNLNVFGHLPQPNNVFKLMAFSPILRTYLTRAVIEFSTLLIDSILGMKRVNKLAQEIMESVSDNHSTLQTQVFDESNLMIRFDSVSISWEDHEKRVLSNAFLDIHRGDLVLISGSSKSGKTSVLYAMLRELSPTSGQISINGTLSFSSQTPWLFAGTIRQNILFSEPLNIERYNSVIFTCCLQEDFETLPLNDLTEIGESGSGLSGGQKARVSLARAIYRNADIYLLDDPFAALDYRTKNHIMEKCIDGFLKTKTVVICSDSKLIFTRDAKRLQISNGVIEMASNATNVTNADDSSCWDDDSRFDALRELKSLERVARKYSIRPNQENDEQGSSCSLLQANVANAKDWLRIYTKLFTPNKRASAAVPLLIVLFVLSHSSRIIGDNFLANWLAAENANTTNVDRTFYEVVYLGGVAGFIIFGSTILLIFSVVICYNTFCVHTKSLSNVMRTYSYLFENLLRGVTFNRFSVDIGIMFNFLPITTYAMTQDLSLSMALLIYICCISPITLVFVLPCFFILLLGLYHQLNTVATGYQMDSSSRTSLLQHLRSTHQGLLQIRSTRVNAKLLSEFEYTINNNNRFRHLLILIDRFGLLMCDGMITIIFLATAIIFMFIYNETVEIGQLAMSYTFIISEAIRCICFECQISINHILSAARMFDFYDIPQEPNAGPIDNGEENKISGSAITFDNVNFRYYQGLPAILSNLNLYIPEKSKVAIVGPTGAGKSTIFASLLRLGVVEGKLTIGDIDTSKLSLSHLRRNLSILPQESVFIKTSLRQNLDPFGENTDQEIWDAIEKVGLRQRISLLPQSNALDYECGNESDFGISERQLLWLAKILMEKKPVVLIDEASSKVDMETQQKIKHVISEHLNESTVISIMHKIEDCLDNDLVLLVENGNIVETGKPTELLNQKNSLFHGLMMKCETKHNDIIFPTKRKID